MSAQPTLYYVPISPPCRTVLLVAKALDIELNLELVDMATAGHLKPEFLKMNPQHSVPTLDDNGQFVWDSHAISTYLIEKFGKSEDHPLYPKNLYERAIINQRLQFDGGILYPVMMSLFKPIVFGGATGFEDTAVQSAHEALAFLEQFLAVNPYLTGDHLTVADLSVITSVTQLDALVSMVDAIKYPQLDAWVKRIENELPYFHETNTVHLDGFKLWIASVLEKNNAAKK